jgi:hypothetical protein
MICCLLKYIWVSNVNPKLLPGKTFDIKKVLNKKKVFKKTRENIFKFS